MRETVIIRDPNVVRRGAAMFETDRIIYVDANPHLRVKQKLSPAFRVLERSLNAFFS